MNATAINFTFGRKAPQMQRVLTPWDLILYGVVAVTPCAPTTVFGVAQVKSGGYVAITILAAMLAMVLTASSFGRMASLYPSAGSAFAYVSQGIHPYLGFVAGWGMLLGYLLIPMFCVTYAALALQRLLPALPFPLGVLLFAAGITLLNLRGLRSTARVNRVLLLVMFAILLAFVFLSVRYLLVHQGPQGLLSLAPFYRPGTFDLRSIASGTSFAAFTFLGFDAVTTLSEEVENPRRSVPLAAVAVCVFTGVFGGLLVYLGHLVWPSYSTFVNVDTAFIDVTGRVGGVALLQATATMLVVANLGAALTCQVGGARLLFGLGREEVIPGQYFARLHPVRHTPDLNLIFLGVLAFVGAQVISYELMVELLNFGAFLGFMGVNAAVIWEFWVRQPDPTRRSILLDVVSPLAGFVFCAIILLGLDRSARIGGCIWLAVGFIVIALRTRWFRRSVVMTDPSTL